MKRTELINIQQKIFLLTIFHLILNIEKDSYLSTYEHFMSRII